MIQDIRTVVFSVFTLFLGLYLINYFNLHPAFYVIWGLSLPLTYAVFRNIHSLAMFYRCTLPLVVGLLFILFYIESHKLEFMQRNFLNFEMNEFYGEQFYGVISTLYAIITALVLVKGIESFDKLSAAVIDEANKIRSILEFLEYFNDGNNPEARVRIQNIRGYFKRYISNVLDQIHTQGNQDNFRFLRHCCQEVAKLDCKDENDKIALGEVMKGLNDLFSIRSRRINCVIAKIPAYLIFALFIMTLSIIVPFFLHPTTPISQNYTMIFLMATFGSFLLLMLLDINTPFDGFWRVNLREFRDLLETIEKDIQQSNVVHVADTVEGHDPTGGPVGTAKAGE